MLRSRTAHLPAAQVALHSFWLMLRAKVTFASWTPCVLSSMLAIVRGGFDGCQRDGPEWPPSTRADAHVTGEPPQASAAAAGPVPEAADAGDDDWALSDDDGADDEATLDAEQLAALADGVNVKVNAAPFGNRSYVHGSQSGGLCMYIYQLHSKNNHPAGKRFGRPATYGTGLRAHAQEEEAAEVGALADEADLPLDELLAQYGIRIGADGSKQLILHQPEPAAMDAEDTKPQQTGAAAVQPRRAYPLRCSCSMLRPGVSASFIDAEARPTACIVLLTVRAARPIEVLSLSLTAVMRLQSIPMQLQTAPVRDPGTRL